MSAKPKTGETKMDKRTLFRRYAKAQDHCRLHAQFCHECYMPIIDDEGNPQYFGEACAVGYVLLKTYVDAENALLNQKG